MKDIHIEELNLNLVSLYLQSETESVGKPYLVLPSGPERYLTDTEEQELVHFIKECARVGYAKTRKQIISIVELTLKAKRGLDTSITPGWWYSFRD